MKIHGYTDKGVGHFGRQSLKIGKLKVFIQNHQNENSNFTSIFIKTELINKIPFFDVIQINLMKLEIEKNKNLKKKKKLRLFTIEISKKKKENFIEKTSQGYQLLWK